MSTDGFVPALYSASENYAHISALRLVSFTYPLSRVLTSWPLQGKSTNSVVNYANVSHRIHS